ncbi:hypothetical protein JWG39_00330 [Desulforhopalus vacuolatus]|uniref:OmpW family outer membrane protein n=1 Tax=Desulforhopalus vacuolatus TaxID=40414 RepID=UPI0019661B1D|nr:OmpW family outer membrane protein [Desulforhopalus vacuolatus]MBM9518260.1 hypothetical protein [Desulforhopalus vacuolatus]
MQNVYNSKVLHVMILSTLFLCAALPSFADAEEVISSTAAVDSEAVVSGVTVQDDEISTDAATVVTAAEDKTADKAEAVAEEIALEVEIPSTVAADSEAVVSEVTVQDDEISTDAATAVTAAEDKTADKAEAVAEEIALEVEIPASQVEEETAAVEDIAVEVIELAEETSPVSPVEPQTTKTVESADGSMVMDLTSEEESEESVIPDFIRGHLQIGTRSVYRTLTDDDSGHKGGTYGTGTYLGTIYALDEDQNVAPMQCYLTYFFNDYVGIEFAYDQMEAETVATNGETMDIKTDGNVTLAGPTISVIGRYKNKTSVTPFIGIGAGFFSGGFDATSTWTHDISRNDTYRYMNVDDVTALLLTAGAEWEFVEHWMLNLSMQYVSADVDAEFDSYLDGVQTNAQTGHFPMDNIAFRLGIAYQF